MERTPGQGAQPPAPTPAPAPVDAPDVPGFAAAGSPFDVVRHRRALPPRPASRIEPWDIEPPASPSFDPPSPPNPARWFADVPVARTRPVVNPPAAPLRPRAATSDARPTPYLESAPSTATPPPRPAERDRPLPTYEPEPAAPTDSATEPAPAEAATPMGSAPMGAPAVPARVGEPTGALPMVIVPPPGYAYQLVSLDPHVPPPTGWAPPAWGPPAWAAAPAAGPGVDDERSLRAFLRRLAHPDVALPLVAALLILVVLVAWVG